MNLQGTIIAVLPVQGGISQSGKQWQRQTAVIQTQEQYPKTVAFELFGDRVERFAVKQGEQVSVDCDVKSHEYQGRWFTSVEAWNVTRLGAMPTAQQQSVFAGQPQPVGTPNPYATATAGMPTPMPAAPAVEDNDLPF